MNRVPGIHLMPAPRESDACQASGLCDRSGPTDPRGNDSVGRHFRVSVVVFIVDNWTQMPFFKHLH